MLVTIVVGAYYNVTGVCVFFSVAFQSTIVHIQYNTNATATDCCLPGWPLFSQRNMLRDLTYLVQIDMLLLLLHCHQANAICEIMFQSIIGVIISINNLNRIFMFLNNRRKKVLLSLSYTIQHTINFQRHFNPFNANLKHIQFENSLSNST